ncbi:hypothetical protein D3C81_1848830 [compost metagenome]
MKAPRGEGFFRLGSIHQNSGIELFPGDPPQNRQSIGFFETNVENGHARFQGIDHLQSINAVRRLAYHLKANRFDGLTNG